MPSPLANRGFPFPLWQRIREYAVPPSMIETATTRRLRGDWAGACSAAHVDVDVGLRTIRREHGAELATMVRTDLRHLAPDLLRWHMPRVHPDGLLRPGVTLSLAVYPSARAHGAHLVVRTPPAWAAGTQRMSLGWWDGAGHPHPHPHPRPSARFRLDLHRHLWDARRAHELPDRAGIRIDRDSPGGVVWDVDDPGAPPDWAAHRWAAEAAIVRDDASTRWAVPPGVVEVRLGGGRRVLVPVDGAGPPSRLDPAVRPLLLPEAGTRIPPDPLLLRAGLVDPGRLHPLVRESLAPGTARRRDTIDEPGNRLVECLGVVHRLAVVEGTLTALDHPATETRRELLLAALGGPPRPCFQAIADAHRIPRELAEIRARLDHGDVESAARMVADRLGEHARLPEGDLRDEFDRVRAARIAHGLYRAGIAPVVDVPVPGALRAHHRLRSLVASASNPRHRRDRATRRLLHGARLLDRAS